MFSALLDYILSDYFLDFILDISIIHNMSHSSLLQLCGGKPSEGVFVGAFLSMSSTAVVILYTISQSCMLAPSVLDGRGKKKNYVYGFCFWWWISGVKIFMIMCMRSLFNSPRLPRWRKLYLTDAWDSLGGLCELIQLWLFLLDNENKNHLLKLGNHISSLIEKCYSTSSLCF